jgi:hypothetical protein
MSKEKRTTTPVTVPIDAAASDSARIVPLKYHQGSLHVLGPEVPLPWLEHADAVAEFYD